MIKFDNYNEPQYKINKGKGMIIGSTEIMLDLFYYINHLANLPTTVLLMGETGTGKELFAKAMHYNGLRYKNKKNFVTVNCAGIPSELLESELFGYTKGSFTGAHKDTNGKFQYAHQGTILLDEIGDMSPKLQSKVLRVLQEKSITKIGGNNPINVDVRVIAATNKNLEEEVKKGNFREDLYYRINVAPIKIPTLNKRREDIPLIAEYFVNKYNDIYNVKLTGLSKDAKEKLKWAQWKGNVRELENIIEKIFVLKSEGEIDAKDIHFSSELPEKIFVQRNGFEKIFSEEEKIKNWFDEGILPMSPKSISEFDGSKKYWKIIKIAEEDTVYTIKLGPGKHRKKPLTFLTQKSMPLFFDNKDTDDYKKLEKMIINNEFNDIAKQPFAIFSISDLIANPYTLKTNLSIIKAVNESNAYKIPVGGGVSNCFAITPANASYFVSEESTNNLESLCSIIDSSYENFVNWNKNFQEE